MTTYNNYYQNFDPKHPYGIDIYVDGRPIDWSDDRVFTASVKVREGHDCPHAGRRWFYCRCSVATWEYKVPGNILNDPHEQVYPHPVNMRQLHGIHPGADFIYLGERIDDRAIEAWAKYADAERGEGFSARFFANQDVEIEEGRARVGAELAACYADDSAA